MPAKGDRRELETEKITINLGYVDLGRIELLVRDGFFSNRSDFIRTAIRNELATQAPTVEKSALRQSFDMGLRDLSRVELQAARATRRRLDIHVIGLVRIAADVTPELAAATIASIKVLGALHASSAVKAALAGRVT